MKTCTAMEIEFCVLSISELQGYSKLLSGFLWPIIFKTGNNKKLNFLQNVEV
jgi:hypothetical protein